MDLVRVTQDIVDTHHALLKSELPRLDAWFGQHRRSEGFLAPWRELRALLDQHLLKEEEILFPAIRRLAESGELDGCGVEGPIFQMQHEHARIRELEAALRRHASSAGKERSALLALLDDLCVHAGKEDDRLFPAALVRAGVLKPAVDACARAAAWHASFREAAAKLDPVLAAAPHALSEPWARFREGVEEHMKAEETVLFPAVAAFSEGRDPGDPSWLPVLEEIRAEPDLLGQAADALRAQAALAGDLQSALETLLDELVLHARLEDELLLPAVEAAIARWADRVEPTPPAAHRSEPVSGRRPLRHTQGACNECSREVPAQVVRYDDAVHLEKTCPEHGVTRQLLSRAPEYWEDLDSYYFRVNSESYRQRDYIVRMTETCNLDCPICLAKANTEDTPDLDLTGLEKLLSERRGIKIDLMAAEPTLRKDLEDWVRRVKATGNIAALHTNGLKLADLDYARKIKEAGIDEVFVQFDGFDEEANKVLRGRPLLKARMKAMDNLRELGLATSLIVVIARGLNEAEVANTYRFALRPENAHIREVFFLGLRVLGSARDLLRRDDRSFYDMSMMPDETLDLLCAQEPSIKRDDVRLFNKLYFAYLSAFKVKKCLYVQHYLVERDGKGGGRPFADLVDLAAMGEACDRYADRLGSNPRLARARLFAELGRLGLNRETMRIMADLAKMQFLLKVGMNLTRVPRRFLILGFITACDPHNFDAQVAVNCGKGELSVDGGFIDSGAVANVERERRFDATDRRPGDRKRKEREERRA